MHKQIPKSFIFIDKFTNKICKHFNTDVGVIYRNYDSKDRKKELIKLIKICKKAKTKIYVSNDLKLALNMKANGLYIPSYNRLPIYIPDSFKKFVILGSAHNQKEIYEKKRQKCSLIFLSPIFKTKNYKKTSILGVYRFNILAQRNKATFYALGGINAENINKLKLLKIKGFGAINLFKKKTGLKKLGRFL